jgi:hypothetical protein
MSPALNAKLGQLATFHCATKAEILRKAIILYELAHRTSLKDQRLGVFDEDERLAMRSLGYD